MQPARAFLCLSGKKLSPKTMVKRRTERRAENSGKFPWAHQAKSGKASAPHASMLKMPLTQRRFLFICLNWPGESDATSARACAFAYEACAWRDDRFASSGEWWQTRCAGNFRAMLVLSILKIALLPIHMGCCKRLPPKHCRSA